MRAFLAVIVVVLLAGCGRAPGTMGASFPEIESAWTPPDRVEATTRMPVEGRDISNATAEAYLVAGPCPPRDVVPNEWIDRAVHEFPASGRFEETVELTLEGSVAAGDAYAVMVGTYHPQTVPGRGWCKEYVAAEGDPGRAAP